MTTLQQTNTLLNNNNTVDAEDALALQVFKQTAGQGCGLGAEFGVTGFLEYLTYKGLKQRVVNDSPAYFPTNTTSSMLTYMQNTFLRETVYDLATNAPRALGGVKNDLTPTTQAQINNTYNVMNYEKVKRWTVNNARNLKLSIILAKLKLC